MNTIQTISIVLFFAAFILVKFAIINEMLKLASFRLFLEKVSIYSLVTVAGTILAYGIFATVVNLF